MRRAVKNLGGDGGGGDQNLLAPAWDQLLDRGGGGTAMPLLLWHLPIKPTLDREVLVLT